MIAVRICEAIAIFILFNDDQDTLSTEYEIEMIFSQLIFSIENISKSIWYNDISTIKNERQILW